MTLVPATTSTKHLELLDDDEHIIGIKIVDGDHRLKNYSSILTVHPEIIEERPGTLVIESFVVDIPDGNTNDETCYFVKSLINCNLNSISEVSKRMAVQNQRVTLSSSWRINTSATPSHLIFLENKHISRTLLGNTRKLMKIIKKLTAADASYYANIVAAFARTSREDLQKLLAPEYYPSWVVFSQRQKLSIIAFLYPTYSACSFRIQALIVLAQSFFFLQLTWLNSHLTKIWPHVNEAASELIKANVEPDLEQYRPIILSSLTFSKLTLGTVAPQFTGEGYWIHSLVLKSIGMQTLLSELSNKVGFPVTNTSFDALLESFLSTAKPFSQSARYRI
ncbi:abscisic acid receptor PYL9 [Tanacetum coccineum]